MDDFSNDLQRKSRRPSTLLNMSFSLVVDGQTLQSRYPVLRKIVCKGTDKALGPLPKDFSRYNNWSDVLVSPEMQVNIWSGFGDLGWVCPRY